MILNKKGEILRFIKMKKKARTKDIHAKFGGNGNTQSSLTSLKMDGLIMEKPFDCGTCFYWVVVK